VAWQDEVTTFVTERGPALVGYARLLTGDHESAQDLVQDALAKAWSRRRAGTDIQSLEAYVRRAVLTTYLDGYRRRRLWRDRAHLLVTPEAAPSTHASTETSADLAVALRQLAPRERACVVLRFYDDLPVAAIAARLGLSEGAVKRYLSDGTRRLGLLMGTHDPAETVEVRTATEDRR
jgi:RNA polymerase sigma-70 factor (ECF subfamily)